MKKGIGGGLDIAHGFIIMGIAIFLFFHGLGGNAIGSLFLIILAVALIMLEIMALVG